MAMKERFDYVIIGAGSAGCVMANRLSADPENRVLLIEAGPRDRNPVYRIPLFAGRLYRWKYNNWAYQTEPEPHLDNRRIDWPRGRVLGGSSAINGMIYARGNRLDYDGWAQLGLSAWSYDRVLPYFKKSENYFGGADEYHGGDGPLPVTRMNSGHPMFDCFIEAGKQAGYRYNPDFNGADQEGVGHYDYNITGGERWSAARAYVHPALSRPNLTVITGAALRRIVIENGRAVGVRAFYGGAEIEFAAEREVIVSCGAVASPMALMHSGIGDADDLRALGIPVVVDAKGVGQNLQDHLNVSVFHAAKMRDLFYDFCRADKAVLGIIRAALFKTGQATLFPHEGAAFLRTDPAAASPDIQIHFMASGLYSMALRSPFAKPKSPGDTYGFTAHVCQLRPESRGELKLRSSDPAAPPVIRANYLATETDKRVLREGYKVVRNIFSQKAFDAIRGPCLVPDKDLRTEADIDAWVRARASTIFHPVGTCRMGVDPASVVDEELRVRGVEGLRVVDASVMPRLISANTHAPTVMIAERAADLVLGRNSIGTSEQAFGNAA
jgi:choline dehydrogenase